MEIYSDITLEDLNSKPLAYLCDTLTPNDLQQLDETLTEEEAILKQRRVVFDAVMARKFAGRAQTEFAAEHKDTGTVRIPASNALQLKVEVAKTVKWDQAILRAALNAMPPADAQHYGKVKIEVEERKFAAAPPATQVALARARTVVPGKMKFSFVSPADEQQEAA